MTDAYTYQYTFNKTPTKSAMIETHSLSEGETTYKSGYKRKFDGEHTKERFYDYKYSPDGDVYVNGTSSDGSDWKVKKRTQDMIREYDMNYKMNPYFYPSHQADMTTGINSETIEIPEVRRSKRLQGKEPETYTEDKKEVSYHDKFMDDYQEMKKHMDNKNKVDTSNLYDYMY